MTNDLVAFLRARLDEDEQIARDPMAETWTKAESPSIFVMGGGELVAETGAFADARHIARHDPARVLTEVDAKRRILKVHFRRRSHDWDEPGVKGFDCAQCADRFPCTTLRLLALPYADHPDYREEWRP